MRPTDIIRAIISWGLLAALLFVLLYEPVRTVIWQWLLAKFIEAMDKPSVQDWIQQMLDGLASRLILD